MCGISGIYDLAEKQAGSALLKKVEGMVSRLEHRGPDSRGSRSFGPLALGAARLAILDISDTGNQPMSLEDDRFTIVFNGEIYNYLELRRQLQAEGVDFRSGTDTEVLLRMYMRKGASCLAELRGMFAFAVWDSRKKELFLARDRMGEKPLVYCRMDGFFAFASEIKALLTLPEVGREIDPVGLHYGLHFVNVPPPYSAFKDVRKLPPASCMTVGADGSMTVDRYWRVSYGGVEKIADPRECVRQLGECLDDTVRLMCRSDVPIAATLSGGLDSGAVVSSMSRAVDSFDTFCVSCDRDNADREFEGARRVSEMYSTGHHEVIFEKDDIRSVSEVIASYDEPLTSFVPMHARLLASAIGGKVKVALTGNGGDELFGGYADHRFLQRSDARMRLWRDLDRWGIGRLSGLCPVPGVRRSARKYRDWGRIPPNRFLAEIRTSATRAFCDAVYGDLMRAAAAEHSAARLYEEAFEECGATSLLEGFLYQQLMLLSQHSIVTIPDTSGMAASLEYRSPFLDVRMVELGLRIPAELKVDWRLGEDGGKLVMKEALRDRLPADNVGMKKAGFGSTIPYREWLFTEWSDFMTRKLKSDALGDLGLFSPDGLGSAYERARNDTRVPAELLWGVAMVAEWLESNA